ncbi:hypothetical protein RZN05_11870 [Sphingomonas sp. HF-S4]|uniref:Uncharacterized protein n=1 Tax=Sphingomonas agrestis TaxID=3080540 RepID=A0ABU3Y8F8_9SPHN|nr:hypothetical protein [Sphingomonas sp. HF-S4]MDV3457685.1 hypothetical protein [Sphingomonas sp. HF-S4]
MNIIVPIHLEALRVSPSSGQTAKTALYDFTLLGSQPGSAMGDLIASNHFQTAMTKLAVEPGIHIHWSLPRAYTRGVQDEATGQVRYPVVPNRWLVIRFLEDNTKTTDNTAIRLWVLESDAHGSTSENTGSTTKVPWMDDAAALQGLEAHFLGRRIDLQGNWAEPASGIRTTAALGADEVGFLGEMFQATYGYGETFTAYYPNCNSVLGLYDTLDDYFPNPTVGLENNADFTVSYAVMGWVNETSADECNLILNQALAAYQKIIGNKPDFASYLENVFNKNLGWSLSAYDGITDATIPATQGVLSGVLADIEWQIKSPGVGNTSYPSALPSTAGVQVAIGNNTFEAVSVYINAVETGGALASNDDVTSNVEWLLNALQFNQLAKLSAGDVGIGELEQYLHGTAFAATAGGYTWTARQKQDAATPAGQAADNQAILPLYLAKILAQLNTTQRALDAKRSQIAARQKQLFFDWSYHISEIDTNVVTGTGAVSDDVTGNFVVDGLLQLFPALLQAGNFIEAGTPTAPYQPIADPFAVMLPSTFPNEGASELGSYNFNTAANAPAAAFAGMLLQLGTGLDALADGDLTLADGNLAKAATLLQLAATGGANAGSYIASAQVLLSEVKTALQAAQAALAALSTENGLAAQKAQLDAAHTKLAGFIDPTSGVFATALKYTADPGKAPLPPGQSYAGAILKPFGALMSWGSAVGPFPGMKAQMDSFSGQNGQAQNLLDIQAAALYLGFAHFYVHSQYAFKAASAYYLQMAEQEVSNAVAAAAQASQALGAAVTALAGADITALIAGLQTILDTVLPQIDADLTQPTPDVAAALEEIALLLGHSGTANDPNLPAFEATARGANWQAIRQGIADASILVTARLPLAQQAAILNQFLYERISDGYELTTTPADPFALPSEPVMVFAEDADDGLLAPTGRNGAASIVPCRLAGEIVTPASEITYPPVISGLAGALDTGIPELSGTLQALAQESFLLTPELSNVVSAAALEAAAAENQTLHYNNFQEVVLASAPAGLNGKLPYYIAYNWRAGEDPFLPLFIWWETDYRLSKAFQPDTETYPSDFLSQFQLGQYEVELQPQAAAMSNFTPGGTTANSFTFRGLIPLSSASTTSLCSQIQSYCLTYLAYDPGGGPPVQGAPDFAEKQNFYNAYQDYRTRNILSQGLSGFNAGLVQRAQELQIPINIPATWTGEDQRNFALSDFWPTSFLHNQSAGWPVTWSDEGPNFNAYQPGASRVFFNPLRAGFMQMTQITLVDAFGRFVDLPTPNPAQTPASFISENMTAAQPAPDTHYTYLAPRLVQPSRLNFDWVAAATRSGIGSFTEPGSLPAASPICGWLWPNHLDDSLMLYDGTGRPMGSLRTRGTVLHWFPVPGETTVPGADNRSEMLAYFASNVVNPVFQDFVSDFLYTDDSPATDTKFQSFLEVLRKSQQFIVTAAMQQDQALGVLIGQPLVIVQAEIGLEQQGTPYVGLNAQTYPQWNEYGPSFTVTADAYIPYDFGNFNQAGLSAVDVPVRVGMAEIQRKSGDKIPYFDDGVAGYFLDGTWQTLYTPVAMADTPGITSVAVAGNDPLILTPNGTARMLTMVLDPRATAHATTGILPVKALAIPPEQFAAMLDRLEITFLTAPLLVANNPPAMPLPAENGFGWSWVQIGANGSEEAVLTPAQGVTAATFPQTPQMLVDGWLKLHKNM